MTIKRATVNYGGIGLRFLGGTDSGHATAFDDEEGNSGGRPMEVLLSALGACTAMDVLSILRKKHQQVAWYRVRVEGEQRAEHPRVFTSIRLVHELDGRDVDRGALRRAIELSATKYCSVGAMLSAGVTKISHWYLLRGDVPFDDEVGEVVTIGPHRQPDGELSAAEGSAQAGSAGQATAPRST
jgi:putative redox protein